MIDTTIPEKVETPVWYIRLQSRLNQQDVKKFIAFFGSLLLFFITSFIVLSLLNYFIYSYIQVNTSLQFIVIFLMLIISIIVWFMSVKKYKLEKIELFAYHSGTVGIVLDRLSIDDSLYVNPTFSLSWLMTNSSEIVQESLKQSMKVFETNLCRIQIILKNPKNHKESLSALSRSFIALGDYAIETKDIEKTQIRSVIQLLEKIKEPSRKSRINIAFEIFSSYYEKSKTLRFILHIILDFILACSIYYIGINSLGIDKNYAYGAGIGAFIVMLGIIVQNLRKST